jgi:hypothetical protein
MTNITGDAMLSQNGVAVGIWKMPGVGRLPTPGLKG